MSETYDVVPTEIVIDDEPKRPKAKRARRVKKKRLTNPIKQVNELVSLGSLIVEEAPIIAVGIVGSILWAQFVGGRGED